MYLFIDTETGGLTPDYSLLTLSAIVADKDFNPIRGGTAEDTLYLEIRHDKYVVSPEAVSINKLDLIHHSARGLKLAQARDRFAEFVSNAYQMCNRNKLIPAGHNVAFDLEFVQAQLMPDDQWRKFCSGPAFDTMHAGRFLSALGMIEGPFKLYTLCEQFGVELTNAHHAEADNKASLALARAYVKTVHDAMAPSATSA